VEERIDVMKVAVSAAARDINAAVDPRFGRAACFLLVDADTMEYEVIENKQNLQAAQGAGIQAAALVAGSRPEAVITGHCGPKAFQTLKAAGIGVVVGAGGSVREAVEGYKSGKYRCADSPDVESHWV
jgi:predicted Fe-Mo cluster-binding NifX family protein